MSGLFGNRYRVLDQVGHGGMGDVFKATDRLTGSVVALKSVASASDRGISGADALSYEVALTQEFRILSALRHPNIISVLDYGFDARGRPFYTMEFLEKALPVVEAARSVSDARRVDLLVDVLQALVSLHRHGILHRDLKPSNILVDRDRARVLDFGLSISDMAGTKSSAGTPAYMAPEVIHGESPSPASDLFALGLIGYEMFAGRHPFADSKGPALMYHLTQSDVDLENLDYQPLRHVLAKLLRKDPNKRYDHPQRVLFDLCEAVGRPLPQETVDIREAFLQSARFVGREDELSLLSSRLDDAVNGNGGVWFVTGESGVGKSRLLSELRIRGLVKNMLVLQGEAVREGARIYQLWRSVIPPLLLGEPPLAASLKVLSSFVDDGAGLIDTSGDPRAALAPGEIPGAITNAVWSLLESQANPVLIILEDLQWAGNESLDLLARLVSRTENSKVIIVGSARRDEIPDLPNRIPEAEVLHLQRLNSIEIAELSSSILGENGRDKNVLSLLERETEGNAFFLVEILRELAETSGRLDKIGRMELPERIAPAGIAQIVDRRLNRVPKSARPLLQLAALAGRRLDLEVLERLSGRVHLDNWLTMCSGAAVLEFSDRSWRFAHDKLRHGLIDSIPEAERSSLYGRVARAMEEAHPDSPSHVAAHAHLWRAAGDTEKELHYVLPAAKQALSMSASAEAVAHLERLLEVLENYDGNQDKVALELEGQTLLGYALMNLRGYGDTDVERAYRRADELARITDESPRMGPILYGLFSYYASRAEYEPAGRTAARLSKLAQSFEDPTVEIVANNVIGLTAILRGDLEPGSRHTAAAYTLADEFQNETLTIDYGGDFRAYPRTWLAISLCLQGRPDQAEGVFQTAMQLTSDQPYTRGFVLCFCPLAELKHDVDTALARADELAQIAGQHQFMLLGAIAGLYAHWASIIGNRASTGIEEMEGTIQLLSAIKLDSFLPLFLGLLAEARLALDQTDEAELDLQRALKYTRVAGGNFYEAELFRLLAVMRLKSGATDMAEDLLRQSLAVAETSGAVWWQLRTWCTLGEILLEQGRENTVLKSLGEVRNRVMGGTDAVDLRRADDLLTR